MLGQVGLCRTCSETTLLVFPRGGSFVTGSEPFSEEEANVILDELDVKKTGRFDIIGNILI